MAIDQDTRIRISYRYLRIAPIICVVMLLTAVAIQRTHADCWQTSISAYYFTAAHSAFVASLCAIGMGLIVYKGNSDTEDVILNFAGFFAFIVAMSPTARETVCGPGLPVDFDVMSGTRNTVLAVIITSVVAEVTRIIVDRRSEGEQPSFWARVGTVIGWVLVTLGVVAFFVWPDAFQAHAHNVSAVALFLGIIGVVIANARTAPLRTRDQRFKQAYVSIAWAMTLTLVGVVVVHLTLSGFAHAVIVVEVLLILEFAAFWGVQTAELWGGEGPDPAIGDVTATKAHSRS
ncbi:MAG: hypothetical protein ABI890_00745 [Lapillicoccus sp.]